MSTFNVNDYGFSAAALKSEYGSTEKQEHPCYTRELWETARSAKLFPVSYWTWVSQQLDAELEALNEDFSFSS